MRFEGVIKSWNDDRGFGFIEPMQGGQLVFVHIKAFSDRGPTPRPTQRVSFEIELNPEGKKRAKNVTLAFERRAGKARSSRQGRSSARWNMASVFGILAFALIYVAVDFAWRVPAWFAALYFGASFVCFVAYAIDKSAAMSGGWRISEKTLILLGLAGGWPGAIVAQQTLRHKSSKASFRSVFWVSVALNIAGFIAFNSPMGPR